MLVQDSDDAMDGMEVDHATDSFAHSEAERHPLAPPPGYFGNTSRDGNEFLADALQHDRELLPSRGHR